MLFSSGHFFFFFIAFYLSYLILPFRWQNILLLVASYYFYAAWDVRFLALIIFSTGIDYFVGLKLEQAHQQQREKTARYYLYLSLCSNLSLLGFFKYFNFFIENFTALLESIGLAVNPLTLHIILPVGISFYTFQTLSYTLDIYYKRQKPVRQFFDFALFVAFFPQLMAGPIERAKKLLPQLQNPRNISKQDIREGGWLILWGLFKKVFIADNLAPYVDWAFYQQGAVNTLDIYLAIFAFSIQLYCDFSGYSDMARGLARLLGIKLSLNFNLPFWASNPAMLWQRWHITLSNWFRDYLYAPIRKRLPSPKWYPLALIPTMTLVGLWHGAAWKFIVFGSLWGLTLFFYRLIQSPLQRFHQNLPISEAWIRAAGILITFHIWMLFLLFFIAVDVQHGWSLWVNIFTQFQPTLYNTKDLFSVLFYASPLILVQSIQFWQQDLDILKNQSVWLRVLLYSLMLMVLWVQGAQQKVEFIYFQF